MGRIDGETLGVIGELFGSLAKPMGGIDSDGKLRGMRVTPGGTVIAENVPSIESAARGLSSDLIFVQRHSKLVAPSTSENQLGLTAYTEQASQAQRSVRSTDVNDTAAGTGARKIVIVYMATGRATLKEEIVTLSGTSWVNTV